MSLSTICFIIFAVSSVVFVVSLWLNLAMKARLIHWLGGYSHQEFETVVADLSHERGLLAVANQIIDKIEPRLFCRKTEGCAMEDDHLGGCRDISGLCFSTLHAKELAAKRKERETVNVL